jgi:hypothetical protein
MLHTGAWTAAEVTLSSLQVAEPGVLSVLVSAPPA